MVRILADNDLKAGLISKGFVQATKFTWKAMARHVLEIYSEIGAESKLT
jgi:hypothetical protein